MIGLGDKPRVVKAGVVGGSFFEVMGLRPLLGRLLNAQDDGPKAAGAAVLTYRFWTTSLNDDPTALHEVLRTRFSIPEAPLKLDRRAAEAWLGRPRPW